MASIVAQGLMMTMLIACMLGVCMANRGFNNGRWGHRHVYHHPNKTQGPNKIAVGGSENWHFGFNYTTWAFKHGPFYQNDILVFKYDAPTNDTHPHSVYLLPDLWSFKNCNFSEATMLASPTQGGGDEGFEFALKNSQPYYFACAESNGFHCNSGGMKFVVWPTPRGQNF